MEMTGIEPVSEDSSIATSTIIVDLFGAGVIRAFPCSSASQHALGFGSLWYSTASRLRAAEVLA